MPNLVVIAQIPFATVEARDTVRLPEGEKGKSGIFCTADTMFLLYR